MLEAKCTSLFKFNLLTKNLLNEDLEKEEFSYVRKFDQSNQDLEKGIISGIFSASNVIDHHGDTISNQELEKAAHDFMLRGQRGLTYIKGGKPGFGHRKSIDAYVVETWIEQDKEDPIGSNGEPNLLWMGKIKVNDPEIRAEIKKGNIIGFSIGGYHFRVARKS